MLTGAGGTFCSGADLKAIAAGRGNRVERDVTADGPMGPTRMAFTKPVIAAVEGFAVAGGLELAIWCDLRVVASDATFGVYCRRWGVPLIDGGTVRLPRLVGHGRAMDMILTGRAVDADEALRIGLADEVVPNDELHARALALAAQCASGAVLSQMYAKQAIDRGLSLPLDEGLEVEKELFVETFRTNDARIGVRSFLEHGPGRAEFTGT